MFGRLFSRDPAAGADGFRAVAFLSHLVSPAATATVPEGFVAFWGAMSLVLQYAGEWDVRLDWGHLFLRKELAARIGDAAAHGLIRLAGMNANTGELTWIAAATWRRTLAHGGRVMSQADAATRGQLVQPLTLASAAVALISRYDLAVLLGAMKPPPPPLPLVLEAIIQSTVKPDEACNEHDLPSADTGGHPGERTRGFQATGCAKRPQHRGLAYLYMPEARRRIEADEQCPSAALEAIYLREWLDGQAGGPWHSSDETIRRNLVTRQWPKLHATD